MIVFIVEYQLIDINSDWPEIGLCDPGRISAGRSSISRCSEGPEALWIAADPEEAALFVFF